MVEYDKINREIQDFIGGRKSVSQNVVEPIAEKSSNLQYLLESLQQTYNEINTSLKLENKEGVRDAILKNEIRINMVNESLLETLRKSVVEKNRLLEENQRLNREKLEAEQNSQKNRFYAQKLESDVEFKVSNVAELNRIIQDQKQKMAELHVNSEKQKREVEMSRLKMEEMEQLRNRATERYSSYDKEMEMLNKLANEREEALKKLLNEKREEENRNSAAKIKVVEYERRLEMVEKKLATKEKNLAMCNSELSKMLTESKKHLAENEKNRNSAKYYEGINRNLNEQNAYLNKQLNKIIQSEKYAKEGMDLTGVFEKKKKKYRKRIKKQKVQIKKMQEDADDLRERLDDELCRVDSRDDTVRLHNKIEQLTKANREFKAKIENMAKNAEKEKERKETIPLYKTRQNEIADKFSFIKQTINSPIKSRVSGGYGYAAMKNDTATKNKVEAPYVPRYYGKQFDTDKFKDRLSQYDTVTPQQNPPVLPTEYKNEPGFLGGFDEPKHTQKNDYDFGRVGNNLDIDKLTEKLSMLHTLADKTEPKKTDIFDVDSGESIRSFHTTTTLREMMDRTDRLQKKFEKLDDQLNEVKDGNTSDNLRKQMKMYYKDINVENESDII
ncbi:hypothetical protein ECANGB1_2217 [Enterospora canceri]|uniref:Uncharacterized protein n=1 Tax=Enterospora canceri TaxID=1081671 RepID=A0A1Y1S8M2_9MICR|nr:hypothetical protein ECANGB1_2217 [Enterospora canceri]